MPHALQKLPHTKHSSILSLYGYATGVAAGLLASSSMSVARPSLLHPLPPCSMTSWPHAPEMSCPQPQQCQQPYQVMQTGTFLSKCAMCFILAGRWFQFTHICSRFSRRPQLAVIPCQQPCHLPGSRTHLHSYASSHQHLPETKTHVMAGASRNRDRAWPISWRTVVNRP